MRVALEAIRDAPGTDKELDGWKLFLLAPRMLLFRPQGVTRVLHTKLGRREHLFCAGRWTQLLRDSAEAARAPRPQGSADPRCPPEDGSDGDIRRRAERATALAHLGELSAAAKALTASPLAPASAQTLAALRDPERRPPAAQVPLDPNLGPRSVPAAALSRDRLLANLRRARRGAAVGPSGCTNEHLRVLLDDEVCSEFFASAAARLAGVDLPPEAADALRLGRMVALTKPTGGVRALVMGDVFRRPWRAHWLSSLGSTSV